MSIYIWGKEKHELASTANPYYYYDILKNKTQEKKDKNLIKLHEEKP